MGKQASCRGEASADWHGYRPVVILSHELHPKHGQVQENSGIVGCLPHTSNVFENDTEIGNWKTRS